MLARCVACSTQTFADEHWGRAPLLSRTTELGSDFTDLLSVAAIDSLVSEHGSKWKLSLGAVECRGRVTQGFAMHARHVFVRRVAHRSVVTVNV